MSVQYNVAEIAKAAATAAGTSNGEASSAADGEAVQNRAGKTEVSFEKRKADELEGGAGMDVDKPSAEVEVQGEAEGKDDAERAAKLQKV